MNTKLFSGVLLTNLGAILCAGCSLINPVTSALEQKLPQPAMAYEVKEEKVNIATRTSELLYTVIFRPVNKTEADCLLVRLPLPEGMQYRLFRDAFGEIWASRGYTTIIQNVRGFPPSTGTFDPFRHEQSDGQDTISWLLSQGVCPQVIHTWGGSYFGLTQMAISSLVTGSQMIQISSPLMHKVLFPGGAFALSTALFWSARNVDNRQVGRDDIYRAALGKTPLAAENELLGFNTPWLEEWYEKGKDPRFWETLGLIPTQKSRGPVLLMAGLYDPFLPAMVEDYLRLRKQAHPVKLVIGPWAHAATVKGADGQVRENYRLESIIRPLKWLEGPAATRDSPGVEVFMQGRNQWVSLKEFPPSGAEYTEWPISFSGISGGLLSGGKVKSPSGKTDDAGGDVQQEVVLTLDVKNPVESRGGVDLGFDYGPKSQSFLERRPDVAFRVGVPLPTALDIVGTPKLIAYVEKAECIPDLAVTLVDIFPDGTPYLITEGIKRLSSWTNEVTIDLWPTSYSILRGHRLGIAIAPSKFPKYDLPRCALQSNQSKIPLKLVNDSNHRWRLLLPVLTELPGLEPPERNDK